MAGLSEEGHSDAAARTKDHATCRTGVLWSLQAGLKAPPAVALDTRAFFQGRA
jgi:hypothetical protein